MRLAFSFALAIAALLGLSELAVAQGPPPGGPGGPGGGRPMNPVLRILDADNDGELSAEEMEKAPAALKALDRNKDGKLTDDELRPTPPGGGPGGQGGGPGGRGPGGPGGGPDGQGGPGGPAQSVEGIVARYLSLDANKDGKLTKDEVPERMQGFIARADADNDEIVTKEELTKMAERQAAPAGGGGPGGPGGGGRGPGGPGGFGGGGAAGGPGRGGPPNPQAFIDRALEFDADKDGKLSKDELAKFAEQMSAGRGGPGGPGGPPREGRGPGQPPAPQSD